MDFLFYLDFLDWEIVEFSLFVELLNVEFFVRKVNQFFLTNYA